MSKPQEEGKERECYLYHVTLKSDPSIDYVGIGYSYKHRWRDHKREAKKGCRRWFHCALRRHGFDAFDWKVVARYRTWAIAGVMEQWARQVCGIGSLNMTDGGEGCVNPSPEVTESRRRKMTAHFSDPVNRQKHSEAIKGFYQENPEEAEAHAERCRQLTNPENIAKRVATFKEVEGTPEARQRRSERALECLSHPEVRAKMSETHTKRFEDPSVRQARSEMLNAYYALPGSREKQSIACKEMSNRPEVKAKVAASSKARWAEAKSLGFTNLKQLSEYKANPQK